MPDTKAEPGPFDAFETAKPDEPIFTLQGGDPLAAPLVLEWARRARTAALALPDDTPRQEELLLRATSAEEVAWSMQAYLRGEAESSDQSDAHAQRGQTMADAGGDDSRAKLLHHRQMVDHARRLDDATSTIVEVAEALRLPPLFAIAETLKPISADIRPGRK